MGCFFPYVQNVLNSSVSSSTGLSPHQIVFGRTLPNPFSLGTASAEVQSIVGDVKARLQLLASRQQQQFSPVSFQVGDLVYLDAKNLAHREGVLNLLKLSDKWLGPFRVKAIITPGTTYELELPNNLQCSRVWHASFLKPYRVSETGPISHPIFAADSESHPVNDLTPVVEDDHPLPQSIHFHSGNRKHGSNWRVDFADYWEIMPESELLKLPNGRALLDKEKQRISDRTRSLRAPRV